MSDRFLRGALAVALVRGFARAETKTIGNFWADLVRVTLYVLLPASVEIGYPAFLGIYVIAITLGAVSNVPGGLGVFESTLMLLLPTANPAPMLGSILLFRLVYYIGPFIIALLLLGWREMHAVREPLMRATSMLRRSVESVVPQALATAVFAAGAVLMLVSLLAIAAFREWEEWVNLAIGCWVIASPWILDFPHRSAMHVAVLIGSIVVFLSLLELWLIHNPRWLDQPVASPPEQGKPRH